MLPEVTYTELKDMINWLGLEIAKSPIVLTYPKTQLNKALKEAQRSLRVHVQQFYWPRKLVLKLSNDDA